MATYTARMAEAISDRYLNLIIMPTERCNFRCVYCYESFMIGKMRRGVVDGVKALLSQRIPNLDFLTISWFGGEPLLAIDVIEDISEHVLKILESRPQLQYRGDATTNAYFLDGAVFRNMLRWGIRSYQISFDGTQELHDTKRVLANGGGTFERLWQNLKRMKTFSEEFAVTVRLHLDHDNYANVPEFLCQFKRDFADDRRFTLYVRELSQLSDTSKRRLNVFSLPEAMKAIDRVRVRAKRAKINIRVPERKDHVCGAACYAAKLNSFVVRANGHISKCTVALDSELNDVGVLNEDGTMTLNRPRLMKWVRGLASGDTTELGCPMINIDREISSGVEMHSHDEMI